VPRLKGVNHRFSILRWKDDSKETGDDGVTDLNASTDA
jgi:hypothetical protein